MHKFILVQNSTCFGQVYYHQKSSTVHTAIDIRQTGYADCMLARSGWNYLMLCIQY